MYQAKEGWYTVTYEQLAEAYRKTQEADIGWFETQEIIYDEECADAIRELMEGEDNER